MKIAMGVSYLGSAFHGWQSQPNVANVQDTLEQALSRFVALDQPIGTLCAGRTDTGVHALHQVVHFESPVHRDEFSWIRGTNTYLPPTVAVHWAREVNDDFHARNLARRRRYSYVLLESAVRPSLEHGRVGWTFHTLDPQAMQQAANYLLGEHDFTSFRAAECQANSPIKTLYHVGISRQGAYWRFDFEGNAFLHHMIRNIMGCLVWVGQGKHPAPWMLDVLQAQNRDAAAPTFMADGLYFLGPQYDAHWNLPQRTPAFSWLPGTWTE
mgnify:CR=1 FL=1